MSTHIYVVSSQDPTPVISKLNTVFNVKPSDTNHSSEEYLSTNKAVRCRLSSQEKMLIDYYLQNNLHVKFNELKSYLKTKVSAVDNTILSAYLRAQGYSPARVAAFDGSYTKIWIK